MTGLTVTTPNERDIVVTRFFDAPPQLVFDAHTRPELVRRWLYGPDGWTWLICEIDLRVGGTYHYRWQKDGRELGFIGTFREIAAPARLVQSERMEGAPEAGEVLCTLVLTAKDGGTLMTNTMRAPSQAARDGMIRSGMTGGLEMGYARLDKIFAAVA